MPSPHSSDSPDRPDPADLSTDEIVAAVLAGDLESYRQIVLRYQQEVMRAVNALVFDLSAREDIVQQVFVRAYRALDQYESGRGFGKWLKAIARSSASPSSAATDQPRWGSLLTHGLWQNTLVP